MNQNNNTVYSRPLVLFLVFSSIIKQVLFPLGQKPIISNETAVILRDM